MLFSSNHSHMDDVYGFSGIPLVFFEMPMANNFLFSPTSLHMTNVLILVFGSLSPAFVFFNSPGIKRSGKIHNLEDSRICLMYEMYILATFFSLFSISNLFVTP